MSDKNKDKKKRKSGIPTGNAGEYLVMGELLRRGADVQLADRNTKGYDILFVNAFEEKLHKLQVKTVRSQPWYVNLGDFEGAALDQVAVKLAFKNEFSLKLQGACDFDVLAEFAAWRGHS